MKVRISRYDEVPIDYECDDLSYDPNWVFLVQYVRDGDKVIGHRTTHYFNRGNVTLVEVLEER